MKTLNLITSFKCLTAGLLLAGTVHAADKNPPVKFIKEGVWRGVFTVAETKVPFNFELKGKDAEHATFTLINGSRRDNFHVKQVGKDSVFIKMNTYDAAWLPKLKKTEP
jgi:hypothetical protein